MNSDLPRTGRKLSWPLAFILIFLLALVFLALVLWRIESWPMRTARQGGAELERLGREARDAFVQIAQLQPRVTINNRVYLEQTNAIAELALISRKAEVEHEFEHTWAGSTKRVKLHGSYKVKAGFDLRQNVSIDVRENEIDVHVPRATILGVEEEGVEVLEFENGLWNRISAQDLQNEFAELGKLARTKAAQSGLTNEAEEALQTQLQDRLGTARPLKLIFDPATTPAM